MTLLALISITMGAFYVSIQAWSIFSRDSFMRVLRAFPRHKNAAIVLVVIDLVWVGYLIQISDLDRFDYLKPAVYVVGPISLFLLIHYLDELLAPRALGGFILLIAHPILTAARWYESSWKLVIVTITYLAIIKGMIFVLSPYRFRDFTERIFSNPLLLKLSHVSGVLIGGLLISLGFTVF